MDFEEIHRGVLSVLRECRIFSYPFDCMEVMEHYGYKIVPYHCLPQSKKNACLSLSSDACILDDTLFYNHSRPRRRVRFSVMHELGHIILDSQSESDANKFASYILAPRMAIHYSRCKNAADVSRIFALSEEAAEIAFDDYRRWHRIAAYRMSMTDREIYRHFYNEDAGKFVYINETCPCCGRKIYNSFTCLSCSNWNNRTAFSYNTFDDPLSPDSRAMGAPF